MASGAGALYLAEIYNWQTAYFILSFSVIIGMAAILLIHMPKNIVIKKNNTRYFESWITLFSQPYIIYLLGFIFFFKLGDTALSSMMSPFLWDLGYSKIEFANVSKFFGILMMVLGGLGGGLAIYQLGLFQTLIFCTFLQGISCLFFVVQSLVGYNLNILYITVGVESLTSGAASAAFIAYLSHYCKTPYSASHFTLLYALGSMSRVIVSSISGFIAHFFGWPFLFFISSLSVIPVIYFLTIIRKKEKILTIQTSSATA